MSGNTPLYVPQAPVTSGVGSINSLPTNQQDTASGGIVPELKMPEIESDVDDVAEKAKAKRLDEKLAKIMSGSWAEPQNDEVSGALGVDSVDVDDAIDQMMSLPEVLTGVAIKERKQIEELERQQDLLTERKNNLDMEQMKLEEVKIDLMTGQRNVYLAEGRAHDVLISIKQIQADILRILTEKKELKKKLW